MEVKPSICVVDDDEEVLKSWHDRLAKQVHVFSFHHPGQILVWNEETPNALTNLACIILGRFFDNQHLDMLSSEIPLCIKRLVATPIFLNWQGTVPQEDMLPRFDGKIFQKYGVKWQTLRLRIRRFSGEDLPLPKDYMKPRGGDKSLRPFTFAMRKKRCEQLLQTMVERATGVHRQRLAAFYGDNVAGEKLLEAIYNRLLTDKSPPDSCPSRYINSSPVIAQKMLREALYG